MKENLKNARCLRKRLLKIFKKNLKFFASPLARGIILRRQEEFPDQPKLNVNEVKDGSKIKLGQFKIEF